MLTVKGVSYPDPNVRNDDYRLHHVRRSSLRGIKKIYWMTEDWEPVRVDTTQFSYTRSDNSIMNCTLTPVSWHVQFCCLAFISCLDRCLDCSSVSHAVSYNSR